MDFTINNAIHIQTPSTVVTETRLYLYLLFNKYAQNGLIIQAEEARVRDHDIIFACHPTMEVPLDIGPETNPKELRSFIYMRLLLLAWVDSFNVPTIVSAAVNS